MYTVETHKYIALDFDGTLIPEGYFPHIGPFKEGAIDTLKDLLKVGYEVGIWTCRGGFCEELGTTQEEAILQALVNEGVDISGIKVNEHFPYYLNKYPKQSPKIYAHIYIDDRAFGISKIDWKEIRSKFKELN